MLAGVACRVTNSGEEKPAPTADQLEKARKPTFYRNGRALNEQINIDIFDAAVDGKVNLDDMDFWFSHTPDDMIDTGASEKLKPVPNSDFTVVNDDWGQVWLPGQTSADSQSAHIAGPCLIDLLRPPALVVDCRCDESHVIVLLTT